VQQIAERLDLRFRMLTGGSRTALARQRTLQATVDWSHELLSDPERTLFRRLAVFGGGWTLEAAERVCADEAYDVLDLLGRLAAKSMVLAEEGRFRMLETMRQYAQDRLLASGELAELRHRHLDWVVELSAEAEPHMFGAGDLEWRRRLRTELDNIRSAVRWALDSGRPQDAVAVPAALNLFWYGGRQSEGAAWLQEALNAAPAAPANAAARAALAWLAEPENLGHARKLADEAVAAASVPGAPKWTLVEALGRKVGVSLARGEPTEARAAADALLGLAAREPTPMGVYWASYFDGSCWLAANDLERCEKAWTTAVSNARALGNVFSLTRCLAGLASVREEQDGAPGDYMPLFEEGLELARENDDPAMVIDLLMELAILSAYAGGDHRRATALAEEALSVARRELGPGRVARALGVAAQVGFVDDIAVARARIHEAIGLMRVHEPKGIANVFCVAGAIAREDGRPSEAAAHYAAGLGVEVVHHWEDRIITMRVLEGLAGVAVDTGRSTDAARLFAAAEAVMRCPRQEGQLEEVQTTARA